MKHLFGLILVSFLFIQSYGQNTWSSTIAPIVYNNCTSCHNSQGIAPFSLVTYTEAKAKASFVKSSVVMGTMPPWIADSDYQSYAHERVLSDSEIAAIVDWVDNGSPEGNASETPPPPVYSTKGFITETPDLELKLPVYTSKASATQDDYVCFSMATNLAVDKKIRAFEVIPGNHSIVHHALIYIDESGNYPTDTSGGICVGPINGLIGGYAPGSPPTVFPTNGSDFNLGFVLKGGSNIVLAMHYPEGSFGMKDSTIVRLWFYDDQVQIRELTTKSLIENWQFQLPPDKITPVSATKNVGNNDVSVLSVFPHMHLLGKDIKSFAVTPTNDTVRFVDIKHWDFEWQEFLFFKNIKKVPKWTVIHGQGSYDNTAGNHHNPNNPPITVNPGLNTSDEMFLIYFHYLPYVSGDENRDIEALTSLAVSELGAIDLKVFPNPATNEVFFSFPNQSAARISIRIYDMQGNLVDEVKDQQSMDNNHHTLKWNVPKTLSSGMYYYSLNVDGLLGSGSVLINR